jgi:hypothetical protein
MSSPRAIPCCAVVKYADRLPPGDRRVAQNQAGEVHGKEARAVNCVGGTEGKSRDGE